MSKTMRSYAARVVCLFALACSGGALPATPGIPRAPVSENGPGRGAVLPTSLETSWGELQPPRETSPNEADRPVATATAALLPARPPLFEQRASVPYPLFIAEVRRVADELATAPEVEKSYRALLADYDLGPSDVSVESYSRVRLVFEATRDGGLWGVKWKITDRMPWSDAVWEQWKSVDLGTPEPEPTAFAECDELSALFASLARDVGVQGFVGLHWPTWNHTVAVWELRRGATERDPGARVRVMVPTSQIWLSREATLGSREFKTDRAVFPYQRKDMKETSELPVALARFLVLRLERYGALSNEALLERRNRLGGS
jgi:hypothetical protein